MSSRLNRATGRGSIRGRCSVGGHRTGQRCLDIFRGRSMSFRIRSPRDPGTIGQSRFDFLSLSVLPLGGKSRDRARLSIQDNRDAKMHRGQLPVQPRNERYPVRTTRRRRKRNNGARESGSRFLAGSKVIAHRDRPNLRGLIERWISSWPRARARAYSGIDIDSTERLLSESVDKRSRGRRPL